MSFQFLAWFSYIGYSNGWKFNFSNTRAASYCYLSTYDNYVLPYASGQTISAWGYFGTIPSPGYYYIQNSYYYETNYMRIWHPFEANYSAYSSKWRVSSKRMINFITYAGAISKQNSNATIAIGDAYAPAWHLNHKDGSDVDIYAATGINPLFKYATSFYTSGSSRYASSIVNSYYNISNTEQFAHDLIITGNVDYILYSDSRVVNDVASWATSMGFRSVSGNNIIQNFPDHYDHFHVRLRDKTFCGY